VVFWGNKNMQKARIKNENKKKRLPINHNHIDNTCFNLDARFNLDTCFNLDT